MANAYGQPPTKHQFPKGQSGNPKGKRRKPSKVPNIKAQLEFELNKMVTIRSGKQVKTLTKAAAGIEQLVDQFAKGDRNARRDIISLCEKLGVNLTNREVLQGALEEVLSAEDEVLLAEFVKRHGGRYPLGGDTFIAKPVKKENFLGRPIDDRKLLAAPLENSIRSQTG